MRTLLFLCLASACGSTPAQPDAGPFDSGASDAGANDAGANDGGLRTDGGPPNLDGAWEPHGFPLRTPMDLELACEVDPFSCPDGHFSARQIDHVCTLHLDGHDLVIYLQADPTGRVLQFSPLYGTTRAWVYDNATHMTRMVDATYDFGGNHHNDFIDATIDGQHYRWSHSSFGFGFRACHPPDCAQKLDASNAITDDGCMPDRTHAEVCVTIEDGTIPSLDDTFEVCPGDPMP